MKVCVIGKYPPIEGGVSTQTYWTCHMLGRAGHNVFVVTNADETEPEHREWFLPGDAERLNADYPGGGSVSVTFTQAHHDEDLYYIPHGRPTITRLASAAVEVVRRHDCDLLIGWYLEPYVLAASLVAAWTRRPYLVRHAGSDAYDLAAQPELGPAYREAIRASAGLIAASLAADGLGMPDDRALGYPGLFLPPEFSATGPVLDLTETARLLRMRGSRSVLRTDPLPPGTALIGAYGKLGVAKGTINLVRAVSRVRAAGKPVGLALAGGGRDWATVIEEVHAGGLADVTVTLPMIAPWRIPSFIRACRAVAFLERDFGVPDHRPAPPVEVLACGRPLLLSADMAPAVLPGRPADDPLLAAVELTDPRDPGALAAAVESVLSRSGPAADQRAAGLRAEPDVARWYAEIFDRALAPQAGPGGGHAVPPEIAAVEQLLTRYCPALIQVAGRQVVLGHVAVARAEPNALLAAYAVADACLPQVRSAISGPAGPARNIAQMALAEHHALWSRVDVEGLAGVAAFAIPVQRAPVPQAEDSRLDALFPVTSSWLRIARFEIDAYAYLQVPSSEHGIGSAPSLSSGPEQVLLFHKASNLTRTIARIGPAICALLAAADGTRSLREHAETLGIERNRLGEFLGSVRELHKAGVVMFRRAPVAR